MGMKKLQTICDMGLMFARVEVEMEATNWNTTLIYRYFAVVLLLLLAVALPGSASAQGDLFYIDSVQAAPGQDIPVRFFMSNSEP